MQRLFYIRLAIENTFKKKLRAILAIGGIALTSAIMITLFGIERGMQHLVQSEVSSADATDVITVTQRNVQQIRLDDAKISEIQSISGVDLIGKSVGLAGIAIYHGISLDLPVYGVSNDYFSTGPVQASEGSLEGQPTGRNVIVSTKVLEVFGIQKSNAIGKEFSISVTVNQDYASSQITEENKLAPLVYTISAVVDRGSLPVIFMPLEQLRLSGVDSVAQLKVHLSSTEKVASVREAVEQMGFQTMSILDTIERINQFFEVIRNILFVFGVVVFIITVSGTFTIITLTLMEETKQIGFLRIMGVRHRDVRTLFIIQSILLTCSGSVVGIVGGVLLGWVVNGLAQSAIKDQAFSGDISIFIIPVVPIIIILMLSVLIGWGVGVLPAKRAALINPLEELNM